MPRLALICFVFSLLPLSTSAGVRRFTYVYEATTSPARDVDLETTITFESNHVAFRNEIEFGVADHLEASIYVANWQYEHRDGARYTDSAVELIYNLTNPVIDPVGLAVYQEYRAGPRLFEWESKMIAQKNFGRFVAAYNATLEAEWEGESLCEQNGELQQSLGISYEIDPRFSVGLECLHEIAFPDWEKSNRGVFFAGPNASIRGGNLFLTVTALGQLTRAGDEPDLQVRAIFGAMF